MIRFWGSKAPSAGAGPFTGHPGCLFALRTTYVSANESFLGRPGAMRTLMRSAVVSADVESARPTESGAPAESFRRALSRRCVALGGGVSTTYPATLSRHDMPE